MPKKPSQREDSLITHGLKLVLIEERGKLQTELTNMVTAPPSQFQQQLGAYSRVQKPSYSIQELTTIVVAINEFLSKVELLESLIKKYETIKG